MNALDQIEALLSNDDDHMDHQAITDALEAARDALRSTAFSRFAGATTLIHKLAVDKGWWDCPTCDGHGAWAVAIAHPSKPHVGDARCPTCHGGGKHRNFGESIALIHSELSEALEAARQPALDDLCDKCDGTEHTDRARRCKKCDGTGRAIGGSRVAEELADTVIRILDLCGELGIDIGEVIAAKHAFNTTRPTRHGKRF